MYIRIFVLGRVLNISPFNWDFIATVVLRVMANPLSGEPMCFFIFEKSSPGKRDSIITITDIGSS